MLTVPGSCFILLILDWVLVLGNLDSPVNFSQWMIRAFLSQCRAIKLRHLPPMGCTGTYVERESY